MKNDSIETHVDREKLMKDYWGEYLQDYVEDEDYWFVFDNFRDGCKRLISPFLNHDWLLSDAEMIHLDPKKCAISKRNQFFDGIKSDSIGNVLSAFYFVEKHTRAEYLRNEFLHKRHSNKFTDAEIWFLISYVWVHCEFNCGSKYSQDCWREIFAVRKRPKELIESLPQKVRIYRGGHRNGFSWSEDIEVARNFQERTANFFARHIHSEDANQVELLSMTVDREDILFKGTGESELVIDPDSMYCYFKNNQFEVLSVMDTKRW
jgi:hypothetical protein